MPALSDAQIMEALRENGHDHLADALAEIAAGPPPREPGPTRRRRATPAISPPARPRRLATR
jgi:hypothetical protein